MRNSSRTWVRAALLGLGLGLASGATPALASKFVGPKTAEVKAKVLDKVVKEPPPPRKGGDGLPELRWSLLPGPDERVAELEVLKVESYDSNGWRSTPANYIPAHIFAVVPQVLAAGATTHCKLAFGPGYENKLELTHTVITARCAEPTAQPSAPATRP